MEETRKGVVWRKEWGKGSPFTCLFSFFLFSVYLLGTGQVGSHWWWVGDWVQRQEGAEGSRTPPQVGLSFPDCGRKVPALCPQSPHPSVCCKCPPVPP